MEEFLVYLQLGIHHIADFQACDHLLFVVTLCAAYQATAWRQILVLVTAFTVGHSLTLGLAALNLVRMPAALVETLIPITILLTAIYNVTAPQPALGSALGKGALPRYALALGFGLIHGLGFSNFFRALMGEAGSILWPLFSFNVGIELGQAAILGVFFLLVWGIDRFWRVAHRDINLFVSGAGAGGALLLLLKQMG